MWILLQPDYSQMESTAAPLIFIGIMIVVVTLGYFSMRSHIKKIDVSDGAGVDGPLQEDGGSTHEGEGPSLEASDPTKEIDNTTREADGQEQGIDD